MTTFQAVNTGLAPVQDHSKLSEETTPTTPRPTTSPVQPSALPDESSLPTPTRATFGNLVDQRPLSETSFSSPVSSTKFSKDSPSKGVTLSRENSHRSNLSGASGQAEMLDSDNEDHDGSDGESVGGDSRSKKKKGQRFFCTDYPPCTLSFTRSEHLARHIRKHTGERPFQCHCSRRFSRLDNLRQHAQTVHVNEEIPGDSLAATGTRFQRQVRTERVRTPGSRSRASTIGSQGSTHSRGHSRNISTSSIASTSSTVSIRDDRSRRPTTLIMPNNPVRSSFEAFRSPPESPANRYAQYNGYQPNSPGGFSTPTSATFSTGGGSPRFVPTLQSPSSNHSRSGSYWGQSSQRRLSVPSGANPFQSPHANAYPPPMLSPLKSGTSSTFSESDSMFGSPTSSLFSHGRRDSATEAEIRRRTWHPETYTQITRLSSGVQYLHRNPPQAVHSQLPHVLQQGPGSQGQGLTLPGIESFDRVQDRPTTPPRRGPSPMQIDTHSHSRQYHSIVERASQDNKRSLDEVDGSLHRNLQQQVPRQTSQTFGRPHTIHFPPRHDHPRQPIDHFQPMRDAPETPKRQKRMAWYQGPIRTVQRTSPEDSSSSDGVPTPSTGPINEYNPSIVHSNGWVESSTVGAATDETHSNYSHSQAGSQSFTKASDNQHRSGSSTGDIPRRDENMLRLDALVAVATSEQKSEQRQ